ncbi:MAG: S-adenosyl-l-methionine hydroxide adenosyltransferase family protein [Cyclobacteriaceae bacterium]
MPLVTFTSDFGLTDYYTAAVKAKLYSGNSAVQIIDVSHQIDSFNIAHASYVLGSVYRDFPANSVHLVSVGASSYPQDCVAVLLDDHFFVAADNGLISLLSEREPSLIVRLPTVERSNFLGKDVLAPAAAALSLGKELLELGTKIKEINRKIPRQIKANKKLIAGNVIHIDKYGNAVTNIDQYSFEVLSKEKNYQVVFGREHIPKIHRYYHDVELGECVLFFNDRQLLEISINQGSAAQLLGLRYDSPVYIYFEN